MLLRPKHLLQAAAVLAAVGGAQSAWANSLIEADLSATCTGFSVSIQAALIPNYAGTVTYTINLSPVAPGTPISRSLPISNPTAVVDYPIVTDSGTWSQPLVGTYDITGTVALNPYTTINVSEFNGGVPIRITCAAPPPPVCGNGMVEAGEQCDDGNLMSGDGCSATCQNEPPPPLCGNGMVEAGEQCDDGNLMSGDGCSATCQIEPPVCGNGKLEAGEQCDDGNTANGDGCSATCRIEPPPPTGGQGCTPGYWKQRQHFDSWVGYTQSDRYKPIFSVLVSSQLTLLVALSTGGGGEEALWRHSTAALLNASNPAIKYAFTVAQVISMVQSAYATGAFEAIKNRLATENERGCPLN